MQRFPRELARTHGVDAEWPDPVGAVALGECFVVETERFNLANGPIQVAGVTAGDAIAIHIESVELVGPFLAPNGGPFHQGMGEPVPLELVDGWFRFPDHFRLRAELSVGNVAVLPAPSDEMLALSRRSLAHPERYPDFRGWRRAVNDPRGKHCHQDCKWARAGSIVHMVAQVDGAGLCLGDVHGYIGEGESAFAAIETAGSVRVRVDRSMGCYVDWPLIETADEIMVCCSDADFAPERPGRRYVDLVREAYAALRLVVAHRIGSSIQDANPIVAAAADIRNCAIYGLAGYVAEWGTQRDGDLSIVAALPKTVFRDSLGF